jgi:hypothetical protein
MSGGQDTHGTHSFGTQTPEQCDDWFYHRNMVGSIPLLISSVFVRHTGNAVGQLSFPSTSANNNIIVFRCAVKHTYGYDCVCGCYSRTHRLRELVDVFGKKFLVVETFDVAHRYHDLLSGEVRVHPFGKPIYGTVTSV